MIGVAGGGFVEAGSLFTPEMMNEVNLSCIVQKIDENRCKVKVNSTVHYVEATAFGTRKHYQADRSARVNEYYLQKILNALGPPSALGYPSALESPSALGYPSTLRPPSEGKTEESSLYEQASVLLEQEKFDEAILILEPYYLNNQADTQAAIILAEAYLGKCDLLKMHGDEQYSSLVRKPFEIGRSIVRQYPYQSNPNYFAEGCYIISYSYMINDRQFKAERYIKKAIKTSPSHIKQSRYYLIWGTANAISALNNKDQMKSLEAKKHFKTVININAPNDHKALSYYWIGILDSKFYDKKEAIRNLNTALEYAEKASTRMRIQEQLTSIQR